MCLDRGNTSPEELETFKAMLESLPEGALKTFLTPVHEAIAEGGGICFGAADLSGNEPDDGEPLPPGIYPPPI